MDFALLVDGLSAEREQGITIDVAYRYLRQREAQVHRRRYAGARAIYAQHGDRRVDRRPRRAAGRCAQGRADADAAALAISRSWSGIRHFVLAVTKMDLVDYDRAAFDAIAADYRAFADRSGSPDWIAIPVSGLTGDNVASAARRWPGTRGRRLLEHLDTVAARRRGGRGQSRSGCRCNGSTGPTRIFAALSGQIAAGAIGPGAEVRILPSGRITRVERIVTRGRRPRRGGRRAIGDADAGRRGRLLARRRDRGRGRSARGRRPVRSDDRVDGRRGAGPGPRLLAEARHADGHRDRPAPQV